MSLSTRSVVNLLLDDVKRKDPPLDIVDEATWGSVSHFMAEHLVEEKEEEVLMKREGHGAKLMLSPDQKRVRPGIGVELAEALGTDIPHEQLVKAMTPVEGIHFYSKGIDDIQDGDAERNEEKTLHAYLEDILEDEDLARNISIDYYLGIKSRNYGIITDLDDEHFSDTDRENLRRELEEAENRLVDGQDLDLAGTQIGNEKIGMVPNYLDGNLDVMQHLHKSNVGKTGVLFGLTGSFVQYLSDYNGDKIEEWGLKAGEAFQIQDDVLDLEQGRLSDLETGNYTVPIYMAERYLHTHPDDDRNTEGERLTEIIRKDDPTGYELDHAYSIIQETPAIEASRNLSRYLSKEANSYLDEVDWEEEESVEQIKYMTEVLGYQREK